MDIDKKSFKIKEANYIKDITKKSKIILCNSFSSSMEFANGWILRLGGEYKNTTAFSVDRDGSIYQHFDPKYYSFMVDDDKVNEDSIGITLVNEGWLDMTIDGDLINLRGQIYDKSGGFKNQYWRGFNDWVLYTEEQYEALAELILYLNKKFNIYNKVITHNTRLSNPNIYDGVLSRSNFNKDTTDVSPAFNFNKLKNEIDEKRT